MKATVKRNLDGCYFRVCRDGKWENVCFSDLTANERVEVLQSKSPEWLRSLCYHLADTIQQIGNAFDIYVKDDD